MRVSEQKIEEIRSTANIVEVVSDYVQLRKRGKNYLGLCPFHSEKTPSFTVSEEKQIFYCFGCHSGGNVFKFVMDFEKISFPEALQRIADKFGITIQYEKETSPGEDTYQEVLYEINNAAARFFSDNLLQSPEGEGARKYFEKRKIKVQSMRSFGLGYALSSRDSFCQHLHKKNIDPEKALHLGLIGKSDDGRYYDKFSGRIIFPIFSPYGRVVAFAGRVFDPPDAMPKYLNSPESAIYVKGRNLCGLSAAKDEIRKLNLAIIVEGYMDLISLHQNGVRNVVAVSGTALTDEQAQLLARYTKNVILLFDADTAGIKASMRSIEILLRKDMEIKIVSLPSGEDPDSFINNYGREKFEEMIAQAKNFLEYQSSVFESRGMFNDASTSAEAIRELVKPLSLINDELKRSLLIKSISQKFNLREILLEKELAKALEASKKTDRPVERRIIDKSASSLDISRSKEHTHLLKVEKELVALLFEGQKNVLNLLMEHIEPSELSEPLHARIASVVFESFRNGEDIIAAALISRFDDEPTQQYISMLTMERYHLSRNWEKLDPSHEEIKNVTKYARDIVNKYKIAQIDEKISVLEQKMKNSVPEDYLPLMTRIRDLAREKLSFTRN